MALVIWILGAIYLKLVLWLAVIVGMWAFFYDCARVAKR